jgi:hypothetical protein
MIRGNVEFRFSPVTEWICVKSSCCKLPDLKRLSLGLDLGQVILQLLKQPTLCGSIEGNREPNGHLCADSRMYIQYARECLTADTESAADSDEQEGSAGAGRPRLTRLRAVLTLS